MADIQEVTAWPKEVIPDKDDLFMRVHKTWVRDGEPLPGAFQNREGGMSTEWSRYATPLETQNRHHTPLDNGVIKMRAGTVRELPGQTVEHTPLPSNRAHTDVYGEKDTEIRKKFLRIFEWAIRLEKIGP